MVASRYRTGDILIDLDAREIRRGDTIVEVEAKVFDLIALLLAQRERALSKRELNDALWGERPVTDAALAQLLRKARRALGDDGIAQRTIRTVHGHGLRWVADVAAAPGASLATPPAAPPVVEPVASTAGRTQGPVRRRGHLAAAVLALAAAGGIATMELFRAERAPAPAAAVARVAVLPVEDSTGEPALGWTRSGLMGLMAGLLGQHGGIDVVASRDVQAVATGNPPTDVAGQARLRRALGATWLLATRLRRVGPVYELVLRLLGPGGGDREAVLHGSAPAPMAVDAVRRARHWLGLEAATLPRGRGIEDPFLAEAYARGLDAQLQGDARAARRYFELCLDQDPTLAWARLGLAIAQGAGGDTGGSTRNARQVAAAASESGDDELLVAAWRQLASLAYRRGDLDEAAARLDAALADMGDNRPLALADLLVARASIDDERGDRHAARTRFDHALSLTRATSDRRGEARVLANLASLDNGAGDAAAAATLLRAALDAAREAGDTGIELTTLVNLGATEANQGHLLAAIALYRQALALARGRGDAQGQVMASTQLAWVLAPFGLDAEVDALARSITAVEGYAGNPYWQAGLHWMLGNRAAQRGDVARAFAELGEARALYAAGGYTRNVAPVLADLVDAAAAAGDAARAHEAAAAFRDMAAVDREGLGAWLPLVDAQLRHVDGDAAGARTALAHQLDRIANARGPAAQAMLFQLGRWEIASGDGAALLARPAWKPWRAEHPEAIRLVASALRMLGRAAEADAEQQRLGDLQRAAGRPATTAR